MPHYAAFHGMGGLGLRVLFIPLRTRSAGAFCRLKELVIGRFADLFSILN